MADIDVAAVRVPVSLPSAVERLLLDVVADGFVVCCCGGRVEPTALVAFYEWKHYIDLVTIRGFDRITTARLPKHGKVDVFEREVVVWAYEGPAEPALRALLNLVHPQHPDAPPPASTWHHARAAAMAKSAPRRVRPNPG
jgi:hypothetical protein